MPVPGHFHSIRTTRLARSRVSIWAARCVCRIGWVAVAAGCTSASSSRDSHDSDLVTRLARLNLARKVEPRLSVPTTFTACVATRQSDEGVRFDCSRGGRDLRTPSAVLQLARQAASRVQSDLDPAAMHAAALVDLMWASAGGIPLERSVSYLRTVTDLLDRPVGAFVDLAAALLVRAERQGSIRDVVEAIEMAERALELNPDNVSARFNLALGLDRLGLDGQARAAWESYLQVDSTSGWADEARARLETPAASRVPMAARPTSWGSNSEVASYAEAQPTEAMLWGWDDVLGAWGTAVLAGDTVRAREHLAAARALGTAVERRNGEASLIDAVRAIDSAAVRATALRALAIGHREYAAGRAAYAADDNREAEQAFERAYQAGRRSRPLAAWASYSRGSPLVYLGRLDVSEASVRRAVMLADTLRHPSVAARARWVLATTLLRQGRYEESLRLARAAETLFRRTGERENLGAVQTIIVDNERHVGDPVRTFEAIGEAIRTLRSFRRSEWLHNALYTAGEYTARDALPRAARRIHDEDVLVSDGNPNPVYGAEARIARARVHAAAANRRAAKADLAASRGIVERLPSGPREWFRADLRLAEAHSALATDQGPARTSLDSALAYWRSQQHVSRVAPVLLARAEAALAAGDVAGGTADFDRALALLDAQGASTESVELRSSLLNSARQVVNRLVMLKVSAGEANEALADLERARLSLGPAGGRWRTAARTTPLARPGEVVVNYALIGDTLLAWTIVGRDVELFRDTIDRAALGRTVERVRASLEIRAGDDRALRDLAALYDWLVRPIERRLDLGARLVVIADGEIGGVPFAALRDTAGERYLVEGHTIRFSGSLRDAVLRPRGADGGGSRALLVADPAFEAREFPGLARLPGARGEVEAISPRYSGAQVLAGGDATRPAFESALAEAGMVHYAGHALFDDARPERSMLVLAGGASADDGGALTAAEIVRLDLRRVRLVVLSGCETSRPRTGSNGFAGLTEGLLAAGVGGVVGSLWRVNDQLTRTLMIEFHDAYRRRDDGAEALRDAQLRLLRSSAAAPHAWAPFRYVGA